MTPAGLPSLAGLRIAVTGASGFCGAAVARRAAAAGADVVCLGRRPGPVGIYGGTPPAPSPTSRGSTSWSTSPRQSAIPGTVGGRERFRAVNVDGSRRLLDAARGRPVVWVSSASVYDPTVPRSGRGGPPVGGQLTAYGRTKAAGEQMALAAAAVVLRPRAVYGHGDRHLLPRIRRCVRAGVALLPGPDVRLSLTAVETSPTPAWRRPVARRGVQHRRRRALPAGRGDPGCPRLDRQRCPAVACPMSFAMLGAAIIVPARPVLRNEPLLTRYAVDQIAREVVLDITKARAQRWQPRVALNDFLATLSRVCD